MLFLVDSTPLLARPEDFREIRKQFRAWIKDLETKKKVVCFYPKTARGSVVIFDVTSNDELHRLMTQWLEIVPVNFTVQPLISPDMP